MTQFVVSLQKDEHPQQTFVFDGSTTLETIFSEVAKRDRHKDFGEILEADYKVFRLTVSRDELAEVASQTSWIA